MPTAALVIWIVTLVVVALVIVPVAVVLLRRTLAAARSIEAYLADILAAGGAIAGHTGKVPALDETLETVSAMKPVAESIEAKTGAVAKLLAGRAETAGKR